MQNKYLQLPLQLNELLNGGRLSRIHVKDSIKQHIWLLVNTYQGEHSHKPAYGFPLWEQTLRINPNSQLLKSHIELSLQQYLTQFETRMHQFNIAVSFENENHITISLKGCTVYCNQEFNIDYQLLVHPLLYK
ncbi:GPW/gp25 family protein [Chitinophaga sp. CB10]|uniref:GPW/gp25 family protein n=1 Tax=Chitinophaga sp. CB10 TaxID=1891659 RepID=UPI0025B7E1C5|nr:GPW/gp25 family protein [Chitinophaga sp. CB10]